ncbi:hypothetical protein [Marivivens aquimaris]|uniref:hypothetical protein n=1 Tax=Marivivens aquimaris TaxID=2774876 RepID=UPI001881F646|nr:hypothetical protein [Marivivens aquimaris]
MTPNFALSLSFEGIRLLQRSQDGWLLVGEAAFGADGMDTALEDLRLKAERLSDGPARVKILIPNDQIKYLSLRDATADEDAIFAELDGTTPYSRDELKVDYSRGEGVTYVAAVAKETLTEAEGFALEHGFDAVCFAAVPEAGTFNGEPFFGRTALADALITKGEVIERDPVPVVVVGKVEDKPAEAPVEDPAPQVVFSSRNKPEPEATKRQSPSAIRMSGVAAAAPTPASETPKPRITAVPVTDFSAPSDPEPATGTAALPRSTMRPGLMAVLLAILLIFLAAVGAWAAFNPEKVSALFGRDTTEQAIAEVVDEPSVDDEIEADIAEVEETELLPPVDLPETNLRVELPEGSRPLSPAEAEAQYELTRVWQRAPRLPLTPRSEDFAFNVATVDTIGVPDQSEIVLTSAQADPALPLQMTPPPAGSTYPRDERGFILASAEGTMMPTGVMVYARAPDVIPRFRPTDPEIPAPLAAIVDAPRLRPGSGEIAEETAEPEVELAAAEMPAEATAPQEPAEPQVTSGGVPISALRPAERPESDEEVDLSGPIYPAPRARPADLAAAFADELESEEEAEIAALAEAIANAPDPLESATALAVESAMGPRRRPSNFDQIVAAATRPVIQTPQQSVMAPTGPVAGGVAAAATEDNAVSLRNMLLLGTRGTNSSRIAVVRLSNGSITTVSVGDTLDGGQVTAISETALNFSKRGRLYGLTMPD